MQGGADELVSGEEQLLEFEDQLQQIEMLVNLKKVADPLLGYAETALHNAQKALDEAEPADEEYTDLRDALQKAQDAYDNISGQLNGYQAQLDEGKRQMYAQGLISSPSLSNEQLVTEAKAALRQMKVKSFCRGSCSSPPARPQPTPSLMRRAPGWTKAGSSTTTACSSWPIPARSTRAERPMPNSSWPTALPS